MNLGIKTTQVVVITTNKNQTALAKEQTQALGVLSQNICQISPNFGYAGAMVRAAEFIRKLDENAIIVNTPADQYIVEDENFNETMKNAIAGAKLGHAVIVGVKINDIVTVQGCGHALYDPEIEAIYHDVTGFVEKPDRKRADELMRNDCSACNTGINAWSAKTLLSVVSSKSFTRKSLETDVLMKKLGAVKLVVGKFHWYDCGTLKALYEISAKTPHHKNASLGKGEIERTDCKSSLFYVIEGVRLRATGVENTAVLATEIEGRIVITVVNLDESQRVKDLANDYKKNKSFLMDDFQVRARNNIIMRTNISEEIRVGFVGVQDYAVYSHKSGDGAIEIAVSQQIVE